MLRSADRVPGGAPGALVLLAVTGQLVLQPVTGQLLQLGVIIGL